MRRWPSQSKYPPDWDAIAEQVKEAAGWKCERCKHDHDPPGGYCLTVHHLDRNKANVERWNLAALCQRCHLYMQPINIHQLLLPGVEVSEWFRPHLAGYLRSKEAKLP